MSRESRGTRGKKRGSEPGAETVFIRSRRIGTLLAVAGLLLLAFPASSAAQTEAQKEQYRKYLEAKESGGETAEKIYEDKGVELPPETESAVKEGSEGSARFGMEMFAHPPSDMILSTEAPVPSDYVLGPGDHIIVNLWGSVDKSFQPVIDREGKVFFPKAGELVLWGLTLRQAEDRIRKHIGRIYSDFEMNLILGKIRSIRIFVGGEVVRPGAYTVSSLHTMFNTLYLAGGPTERGSLRKIRLVRGSTVIAEVDLYELLMEGVGEDVRLESNDIIFVPVTGGLVTVSGHVKRPGVYEMTGGEKLLDAIRLAGGEGPRAWLEGVQILRYEDNTRSVMRDVDLNAVRGGSAEDILLSGGDIVKVRGIHEVRESIIFLEGEVKYPGEYEYFEGMKMSDLIDRKDLLPQSFIDVVFVTRVLDRDKRRVIQVDLRSVLYGGDRNDVEMSHDQADPVIRHDMALMPRDRIEIFSIERMREKDSVSIEGEVRLPGVYDHTVGMRISDLVFLAGGARKKAWMLEAELARFVRDGSRVSRIITFDPAQVLAQPHGEDDLLLEPGDLIFLREMPKFTDHGKVTVRGEALFPGTYVLESDHETIQDLVERAGGITHDAFVAGAVFTRSSIVDEMEKRHVFDVINALREQEFDTSGFGPQVENRMNFNPGKMNRIIIDLPVIMATGGREGDIFLRPGDDLYIPPTPSGISVLGAVASSGTIKFTHGKKASFYVERAGGCTKRANKGEARILKADGRVIHKRAMSHRIEIGDAIVIPEKVLRERDWLGVLQTTVSILASAFTTIYIVTNL